MRAAIVALLLLVTVAHASPTTELDDARTSFRNTDYDSARKKLKDVLYPQPQLARSGEIVEARVLLGACLFEVGNREAARIEFEKALQIEPQKTLDTLLYSQGAVRLFDETKADLEARRRRDAELKAAQDLRDQTTKYLESLRVVETHSYAFNFVPFGAGQFQNHQRGKGIAFAATEGVLGATSVGIFLYLAAKYGLSSQNVPVLESPTALNLQRAEIGAGIGFWAVYSWGVIDALVHYKASQQVESDESLLPANMKPAKPKKTSFHLAPMITPSGAGVGLSWEN